MADFVAVIRRAVDGLTNNTPELRARVYEKARGAVVRQLENMNPRPPEAMFQRQLDKLDAAIRQVEEENSEALPAEAAPVESAAAAAGVQAVAEAPPVAEAVPHAAIEQPAAVAEDEAPVAEHVAPVSDGVARDAATSPEDRHEAPAENYQHAERTLHPEPAHHVEAAPVEAAPEQPAFVAASPVVAAPIEVSHGEPDPAEPDHTEPAQIEVAPIVAEPAREVTFETAADIEPVHYPEAEQVESDEPITAAETADLIHQAAPAEPAEILHADIPAEPAYAAEPSPIEPDYSEPSEVEQPFISKEPVRYEEPASYEEPTHYAEPVASYGEPPIQHAGAESPEEPSQPSVRHVVVEQDDPLLSHFEPVREPAIRHAANRVMEEPLFEPESEFPGGHAEEMPEPVQPRQLADEPAPVAKPLAAEPTRQVPAWDVDIDREPEAAVEEPEPNAPMPRAALTETDVAHDFSDFLKNEFATPAVKPPPVRKEPESEFSWDAPFDDLPDLPKPVAFEEALHARQETMARDGERAAARPQDARAELEDLIGYTSSEAPINVNPDGDRPATDMARAMSKLEGKSFRVHKKNKRTFNPLPIAFGIAAALIVAGGAYAVYSYRDDVTALVAGLMPADEAPATSETRAVEEKPADPSTEKPADAAKTDTAKVEDVATPPVATEEKPTEVASLDSNIAPTKFTQRLLADGTETETDTAKIPVDQSLSEGKTIAGQTEVAANDTAVDDTAAKATDQAAETPGLAVTQKMFLYEERLGDSPVAVPGTVTWNLKNDTTSAGGKEQPMIEATVDVPDRKLKAIVSFKRNSDPSLPASHIIEVVFDLPEDFPEGNVESVQRIAFKQTEQDRGNGLIAVPAKITDDFHMIALNDDADARKVNLELMKTRSWIDIPVVYRNNRRALITFEKGSTGTEAFDKALAQWAALGPTATSN